MILKEKPGKHDKCEFSIGTESSNQKAKMPRVIICNKPAIAIYRDDKFKFVMAYICTDCAKRLGISLCSLEE